MSPGAATSLGAACSGPPSSPGCPSVTSDGPRSALASASAAISAEIVGQEIQQRTADQVFRVLGELKGGAMKLGQALSIFEAALPPELAEPYRATLTRLQESAPPLPASTVHRVLAADLGDGLAGRVRLVRRHARGRRLHRPGAPGGLEGRQAGRGQDPVPGRGKALLSDFTQLARAGRLFGVLMPGLDVKPMLDELRDRVAEELDYHLEAAAQRAFAAAYAGDPDIYVPPVVAETDHVLVTEWMDGTPLSKIISDGSKTERDRAGILLTRFLFSGPARAGLLHADPHPGNFRLLADGRLGVLDFGRWTGCPTAAADLRAAAADHARPGSRHRRGRARAAGRQLPAAGHRGRPGALRAFLAPLAEPSRVETFKFSREWIREEASRVADLSARHRPQVRPAASYVLIHRVSTAGIGVLCQLECEGPFRAEVVRWVPGYVAPRLEALAGADE